MFASHLIRGLRLVPYPDKGFLLELGNQSHGVGVRPPLPRACLILLRKEFLPFSRQR